MWCSFCSSHKNNNRLNGTETTTSCRKNTIQNNNSEVFKKTIESKAHLNRANMNWTEFVSACKAFLALSREYGDSWREEGDPAVPGEYFISLRTLRRGSKRRIPEKQEVDDDDDHDNGPLVLTCRFDVLFSLSYSVPMMFFKVSHSDGSSLSIQEIWELVKVSSTDLWSTVSQMDHPVLQIPFFAFHACQTEKLMETLLSSSSLETNDPNSRLLVGRDKDLKSVQPHEYLISWLSFMAAILQFHFPQQYILHCSHAKTTLPESQPAS